MAIAVCLFAWANLVLPTDISANAATAEGVANQIEGKMEQGVGTAKRNLGKVTGQTEGALEQAKGQVKEGIGTAENKLDDAQDNVEDTSESLIDSVKDFFD